MSEAEDRQKAEIRSIVPEDALKTVDRRAAIHHLPREGRFEVTVESGAGDPVSLMFDDDSCWEVEEVDRSCGLFDIVTVEPLCM